MKNRNMIRANERVGFMIMVAALLLGLPSMAVAGPQGEASPAPPDLTQGGKPDNEHRWTLGATGARGWVWSRYAAGGSENTDARQILITEVAKGSPADGVLQDGDVIIGINGQAFDGNARILFAKALTEAETEAKRGVLKLVRCARRKDGERAVEAASARDLRADGTLRLRQVQTHLRTRL